MNKKVDEDFKYIHDEYTLQCICTELKSAIIKSINYIKKYCIDDESYNNLSNKEKSIIDVLTILENGGYQK